MVRASANNATGEAIEKAPWLSGNALGFMPGCQGSAATA
jgi:hypothetical protein